jgi:hypothetical protein
MMITENSTSLADSLTSKQMEFKSKFLHTASVQKEGCDSKMDEGYLLKKDLFGGVEESKLLPADFYQILSLARRRREGEITRAKGTRIPAPNKLGEALLLDFEGFRHLAASLNLPLVLAELAIIDNESLERARNARNRQSVEILGFGDGQAQQPEFVSVLAAFDEFATDELMMKAWDRAIGRVVGEECRAIVGTPETYNYAYIWYQRSFTEEALGGHAHHHHATDGEPNHRKIVTVVDSAGGPVQIGLPEFYPFGTLTTIETKSERSPNTPRQVASKFLTYIHENATEEIRDERIQKLDNTILLIVPFTRPRLYQLEGLTDLEAGENILPQKSGDQEGGGVFILCRDTFAEADEEVRERLRSQNLETLEDRVRKFAGMVMWLMHRSAILEAKLERDNTREEDLGQYFHLIAKSLRRIRTNVLGALAGAEDYDLPDNIRKPLDNAKVVTERLEDVGDIARHALLLRSGRFSPLPLDETSNVSDFENLIKDEIERAVEFAKEHGIQDEDRRAEVKSVGFALEWDLNGLARIRTSRPYLSSLFDEVFKNALEHGGFTTALNKIKVRVFSRSAGENTYVIVSVANPIRDEKARITLMEVFAKRRFYLGISQIEMLAQVFNLNPPHFTVQENEAVVYCFIGVAR